VQDWPDTYIFPGVFAPILSLDELYAGFGQEPGAKPFDLTDPEPLADQLIEHADAMAAVRAFVTSLPPRDREILRRIYWGGETQTQVAAQLKVSKMAISKSVARLFRQGRVALAEFELLVLIN
jgi:RNA polymerase sigma factor (sigma-70 family)